MRLLIGHIVIHTEELPYGTRSARTVVHYRFAGAVQTDTGIAAIFGTNRVQGELCAI